jgi:hypothetical protein
LSSDRAAADGRWRLTARRGLDVAYEARSLIRRERAKLDKLADELPLRKVLVLSVYHRGPKYSVPACVELLSSKHDVRLQIGSTSGPPPAPLAEWTSMTHVTAQRGRFMSLLWENWGERTDGSLPDWLFFLDDDVRLPHRFLDHFLGVVEPLGFVLANPAQSRRSHAGWRVTRRHWGCLARETRFAEIGPVLAIRREAIEELMPILRDRTYDWGVDQHWAWMAERRGWKRGVVDAVPVRHEDSPIGASYSGDEATRQGQAFLAAHPHIAYDEANATINRHTRLPEPTE